MSKHCGMVNQAGPQTGSAECSVQSVQKVKGHMFKDIAYILIQSAHHFSLWLPTPRLYSQIYLSICNRFIMFYDSLSDTNQIFLSLNSDPGRTHNHIHTFLLFFR